MEFDLVGEKSGTWPSATAAAGSVISAERWRAQLAQAVREDSHTIFATVWTCPPAHPLEARGATYPPDLHEAIERIVIHQIPVVERGEDGAMRGRRQLTPEPYLPLDYARNRPLARKVIEEAYAPIGVSALAMSWLLDEAGFPLGFIAVGDMGTGRALLSRISTPMTEVAKHAAQTLSASLALARGMGAISPPPPTGQVEKLTVRERQVARLVAEGLSNARVAEALDMAEQTVGVHLRRIYRKLGVHSRNELLARGVVSLSEPPPGATGPRQGSGE